MAEGAVRYRRVCSGNRARRQSGNGFGEASDVVSDDFEQYAVRDPAQDGSLTEMEMPSVAESHWEKPFDIALTARQKKLDFQACSIGGRFSSRVRKLVVELNPGG